MTATTEQPSTETAKPTGDALFLSNIVREIRRLKEDRKDINDQLKAAMDAVEGRGFSKKAFAEALKLLDMEDEERDAHEKSRLAIKQALGVGSQIDMFQPEARH